MPPDFITLASRVVRLERRLDRAHVLACGSALLAATLLLSGYDRKAAEVVQAERVELVSSAGVRQAMLIADSLGFSLVLLDKAGMPATTLRLTDEPWLSVRTGRGDEVAGLGAPKVHHLTE